LDYLKKLFNYQTIKNTYNQKYIQSKIHTIKNTYNQKYISTSDKKYLCRLTIINIKLQLFELMSPAKKPIELTLFHARWCHHCTTFLPVWEKMKSDKSTNKNFEFHDYEETSVKDLPESVTHVDDRDVRSNGWPTITMSINGEKEIYQGSRDPKEIYSYIIERLKGKPRHIVEEHDSDNEGNTNDNDGSSVKLITIQELNGNDDDSGMMKGGSGSGSKRKSNKSALSEIRFLDEDVRFSEVIGRYKK
jgi:hypothetical protein